jgi:Heparinase II/III-like protein/Heparinase II/III N-terminus
MTRVGPVNTSGGGACHPLAPTGLTESRITPRLYLEALRAARFRQLVARALRPIRRRQTHFSRLRASFQPVDGAVVLWRSAAFSSTDGPAELLPAGMIELFGESIPYPPRDWNDPRLVRLKCFHLNYGDEILGSARRGDGTSLSAARTGLSAWIHGNSPARQSWHPYALSTRVGNWIAAASLEPSIASPEVSESLWRQLLYLERNIENDILGNHVIRNARALVLGGLAFGANRFLSRGLALLARELPEQILGDGGHYERSPVYHALVLRDLLEVRAALGSSELDQTIARMERFAGWIARPDGSPALFNDGGVDLAPDISEHLGPPESGFSVFEETGYAVIRDGSSRWLAFDCGVAAPPYIPPHAHADALSFQLWLDGQPVIVDPGTFTYEPGPERDWFRGTRSHATVAVDGQDQFRFVGPFRALGIPQVIIVEASGSEHEGVIVAEFNGFKHSGSATHRRRLCWSPTDVLIEDRIEGEGVRLLESSLPLAPGLDLEAGSVVRPAGITVEPFGPLTHAIEERWVSERFFQAVRGKALVLRGEVRLPVTLGWRLGLA